MAEAKPLEVERYRVRLAETKAQLELDLEAHRQRLANLDGGPDEPGPGGHWEHSGYGDHLADDATEVFEREKDLGLEQTLEGHLRQVEHALARIEQGAYGRCEQCGRAIAPARLDAMPEATLCIDCKAREEEQAPPSRRHEPDAISTTP
jgi:RNA polymerase-binding transcription factor DksA